jgi:hypothetical protein
MIEAAIFSNDDNDVLDWRDRSDLVDGRVGSRGHRCAQAKGRHYGCGNTRANSRPPTSRDVLMNHNSLQIDEPEES